MKLLKPYNKSFDRICNLSCTKAQENALWKAHERGKVFGYMGEFAIIFFLVPKKRL